jgi:hypothetical protein
MKFFLFILIFFSSFFHVLGQELIIGSGTNVNGTTTSSPVNIWYRRTVSQMVYTAAELTAAGATTSTDINDLGFFVTQVPVYNIPDYEIKIKHTTSTDADNNFGNGGWTTVKNAHNYSPTAGDWDMFNLDAPFTWNGTDNIVIKICWSAVNPTYNATGQCRVFNYTDGYKYRWTDDDGNSCANGNNPNAVLNTKPQIKIILDTISVWNGSVSTDWFNANNWSAGVPTIKMDAQIPAGTIRNPNLTGSANCDELILEGEMINSASGILNVYRHFNFSGTYSGTGVVLLQGTNNSIMTISSDLTIEELRINKPNQVNLAGANLLRIAKELRIVSGNFDTNDNVVIQSNTSQTGRIDELTANCDYTLDMNDSWGDGWNGGFLDVLVDGVSIGTFSAAGFGTVSMVTIPSGSAIVLNYTSGAWENENTYSLIDSDGNSIFSDGINPSTGNVYSFTSNCTFDAPPITGDITMERYIGSGETYWRFFSSAVQGATIGDYQDDFVTAGYLGSAFPNFGWTSIYNYDETQGTGLGYTPVSSAGQVLQPGEGFMVWSGDTITGTAAFTVDLKGPANQGNIQMPITYTNTGNANEDGWNLVGNPYASTINWNSLNWNKNNMANAIQILNPQTGQYATYVNGAATLGGSPLIASQQAFWVYATGVGASLTAQEGIKSSTDQAFFRAGEEISQGMKISVVGQGVTDECVVRHVTGANESFDAEYDAYKLYGNSSVYPNISLINSNQNEFTVHSFDKSFQEWEIPLKVLVPQTGFYDLTFNSVIELDVPCLNLEDTYTGMSYDISEGSVLNFELSDTTLLPRFIIHVGREYESNVIGTSCYENEDGKIELNLDSTTPMDYSITYNSNITIQTGNVNPLILNDLAAGTYQIEVPDLQNTCNTSSFAFVVPSTSPVQVNEEISNGSIMLNVTGGAPPYQYSWSNGATTSSITDLESGTYFVQITDVNGCTFSSNYAVENTLDVTNNASSELHVYYTANTNEIIINNLELKNDTEIRIIGVNGALIESYIISNNTTSSTHKLQHKLAKGVYMIWVNETAVKFVN